MQSFRMQRIHHEMACPTLRCGTQFPSESLAPDKAERGQSNEPSGQPRRSGFWSGYADPWGERSDSIPGKARRPGSLAYLSRMHKRSDLRCAGSWTVYRVAAAPLSGLMHKVVRRDRARRDDENGAHKSGRRHACPASNARYGRAVNRIAKSGADTSSKLLVAKPAPLHPITEPHWHNVP